VGGATCPVQVPVGCLGCGFRSSAGCCGGSAALVRLVEEVFSFCFVFLISCLKVFQGGCSLVFCFLFLEYLHIARRLLALSCSVLVIWVML
jgi:hypothetical protein